MNDVFIIAPFYRIPSTHKKPARKTAQACEKKTTAQKHRQQPACFVEKSLQMGGGKRFYGLVRISSKPIQVADSTHFSKTA
ncbi:hypothetical protein [Fibrobacter sp.]|uniref:hypothetical protein n=1 Tax=Fibrobacter sp. TaxID=35828 RepID=UPI00388CF8C8